METKEFINLWKLQSVNFPGLAHRWQENITSDYLCMSHSVTVIPKAKYLGSVAAFLWVCSSQTHLKWIVQVDGARIYFCLLLKRQNQEIATSCVQKNYILFQFFFCRLQLMSTLIGLSCWLSCSLPKFAGHFALPTIAVIGGAVGYSCLDVLLDQSLEAAHSPSCLNSESG